MQEQRAGAQADGDDRVLGSGRPPQPQADHVRPGGEGGRNIRERIVQQGVQVPPEDFQVEEQKEAEGQDEKQYSNMILILYEFRFIRSFLVKNIVFS